MRYNHLNITERELIAIYRAGGKSLCQIARLLGRKARYKCCHKKCCPYKILEKPELFALVKKLFLDCQWSPEQIVARLKLENYPIQISYKTIYRAIYAGICFTRLNNAVPRAIVAQGVKFGIVASRADLKATFLIAAKSR